MPRWGSLAEKFWAYVDKRGGDECWLWLGHTYKFGHGQLWDNFTPGKRGRPLVASRVSWILNRGAIPLEMCVCHTCDNPTCVNPSHLFLGTHKDNMGDMRTKGRAAKGEQHGMSKLTSEDVLSIRRLASSGYARKDIAFSYCVSKWAVGRIISRLRWPHLK